MLSVFELFSLKIQQGGDYLQVVLDPISTSPTGSENHLASFRFQNTFLLNV